MELTVPERVIMSDIAVRAAKTFVQTFLATLAVSVATVQDANGAKAAVIAAVAASISATWNFVVKTM
jgi:hypothetical protein